MMFKFALKNILFYRGRSITTFILTFVSTIFFIIYVAFMDGSHNSMLQNSLKVYNGAIQIYHKNYRDIGGNEYLIQDVKSITNKLSNIKGITNFSARYETFGLLSSGNNSTASMVAGIDPKKELELSQLKVALIEGEFLDIALGNCLYMGKGVVDKLKIKVGSEVAFIGAASDNSFAADIFKLCGIFQTGSFEFDSTASFVNRKYFDELMYSKNKASYISLKVDDLNKVNQINKKIISVLDDEHESVTWRTLMKAMVEAMQVDSLFGYISFSLFFIVIFFVIMIYSFINVSSRIKEFGILKSIGLSKNEVKKLLFYEIFIISTLAIIIATPIGTYVSYYFSINPFIIDGISQTYKEYGIVSDEIPLNFDMFTIFWNVTLIYLLNFLSIIYPISYINSFKPIEATRHV